MEAMECLILMKSTYLCYSVCTSPELTKALVISHLHPLRTERNWSPRQMTNSYEISSSSEVASYQLTLTRPPLSEPDLQEFLNTVDTESFLMILVYSITYHVDNHYLTRYNKGIKNEVLLQCLITVHIANYKNSLKILHYSCQQLGIT